MSPIDKAWALLKAFRMVDDDEADEDELDPVEFGDYGMIDDDYADAQASNRTSPCEMCGKRITFDEIGGFSDYGPHCEECEAER
jgi:hypothetical protein|tara:strand:+ start:254 stop:505 length:252 start_codon:yes stop_codon:yes gene_type:complete